MDEREKNKLGAYLNLLTLHRGEDKEAYDKAAAVYDDFAGVWDRHIAAPALEYYHHLIEERVEPGAQILDAGAGTGERTLALLEHARPGEIVALDSSAAMLDIARKKIDDPRVRFAKGDIAALPFEDNSFDVVSCTWAVEIMADPRAVVQEFVRVIKAEGFVVYAFCSLPEGRLGALIKYVIDKISTENNPLTHLLSADERPFHDCSHSSLRQFSGGLTTVASVAKCCPITEPALPCLIRD